jgi:hypothetical protein
MKTSVTDLGKDLPSAMLPREVFTFRPFLDYIQTLHDKSDLYKRAFLSSIIERLDAYPEALQDIALSDMERYDELLNLAYTTLLPLIEDEQKHYRALVLPISATVVYGNDGFYDLVAESNHSKWISKQRNGKEMERMRIELCYQMILEKWYGRTFPTQVAMTQIIEETATGLPKAYRLTFNTLFVDISIDDQLPELDLAKLDAAGTDNEAITEFLLQYLPLEKFCFEGFRMLSVEDITGQHAVEEIRNELLLHKDEDDSQSFSPQIIDSLKMLLGTPDIELGLSPVYQVNNRFIATDTNCAINDVSGLIPSGKSLEDKLNTFLTAVYLKRPRRIFFKEITPEDVSRHFYLSVLQQHGIRSYALVPVFYNDALTGILEIYTSRAHHLTAPILSRLDAAMPFLSQLLQRNTDRFSNRIETIIKENFTSIQPSVQWKFNEAAWHYIRDTVEDTAPLEIENVYFEKVHPLYGAIDIRNSTVERNDAMLKDLKIQFDLLIELLERIQMQSGFSLVAAKIFSSRRWQTTIHTSNGFYHQTELSDFLENDINPFLRHFSQGNPEFAEMVGNYFAALDNKTGIATANMRQLETSMTTVIAAINAQVDEMSRQAQQAFPCFFEKFRTDGVEYDIYLGQSITPDKNYSEIYLKNMRLLQLRSMALIARQTHALRQQLEMPVATTQLIFIHGHSIDIKFRKDERRFDVEGAYNIRYQVIKKRIDKVLIKDTQERLTVPDKIALTYFNPKEADEYLDYIRYLQQEGLLTEEVEFLELEPVQGVVGMKALRVGVRLEEA